MKVVIVIDSFKGSLSSVEAGKAATEGIKRVFPDSETLINLLPTAERELPRHLSSGLTDDFVKSLFPILSAGRSLQNTVFFQTILLL